MFLILFTPALLQPKTRRSQLASLVLQFVAPTLHRPYPNISHKDPILVASLLATFVSSVEGPIIHRTFLNALWAWCVQPTIGREKVYQDKLQSDQTRLYPNNHEAVAGIGRFDNETIRDGNKLTNLNPKRVVRGEAGQRTERRNWRTGTNTSEETNQQRLGRWASKRKYLEHQMYRLETHQIAVARMILMCLHPRALSYLLYLFTFLSRLPKYRKNGVRYKLLSEMFALRILGGPSRAVSESVMRWLLSRWWRIVEEFKSPECKAEEQRLIQRHIEEFGDDDHHFIVSFDTIDPSSLPPSAPALGDSTQSEPRYLDGARTTNPVNNLNKVGLYDSYIKVQQVTPRARIRASNPQPPTVNSNTRAPVIDLGEDITILAPFEVGYEGYGTDDDEDDDPSRNILRTEKLAKAVSAMSSDRSPPPRDAFGAIDDLLQRLGGVPTPLTPNLETDDDESVYSQGTSL